MDQKTPEQDGRRPGMRRFQTILATTTMQAIVCLCLCGCADIKALLAGMQNDINELKTQNNAVVQSNNDVKQTVGEIKEQSNTLIKGGTLNNSGVINRYGAHVWVILGMVIVLVIFLAIPLIILWVMLRHKSNALALITTAVHRLVDPNAREAVRKSVNDTSIEIRGGERAKQHLSNFTQSLGVKLPDAP